MNFLNWRLSHSSNTHTHTHSGPRHHVVLIRLGVMKLAVAWAGPYYTVSCEWVSLGAAAAAAAERRPEYRLSQLGTWGLHLASKHNYWTRLGHLSHFSQQELKWGTEGRGFRRTRRTFLSFCFSLSKANRQKNENDDRKLTWVLMDLSQEWLPSVWVWLHTNFWHHNNGRNKPV